MKNEHSKPKRVIIVVLELRSSYKIKNLKSLTVCLGKELESRVWSQEGI